MQNQENNLQIQIHSKINNPFITYDLKWVPSSTRFLSIGGTGENQGIITVYSLERNQRISIQKKIEGEYNFKCGTFGASDKIDRNISVGDFQGDLKIFDLEYSEEPLFKSSHLSMINSIDGILYNNSPFIAASLQNGNIVCLDPRQQKTIMEFHDNLNIDAWCVKINDQNNPVILTGYENGDFLAVDIRKPTKSNNLKFNLNHPICSIDVKNKNHILNIACSCTENSMIFFDLDLQKDFEEKTKNPLNYQKLDFNKYFNEKNDEKNSEKKMSKISKKKIRKLIQKTQSLCGQLRFLLSIPIY
eukprot:Anaeramoba_ignava/a350063_7.p1 GENE.a350063_7~~a350063_7.p1  ORF type:complete len:302 (-),score=104.55 a350063_7:177-1082(-)